MNARGLGSQLKDSIPVTELSASGPFESHDLLQKGFSCVKNELLPSHPLELSGKKFQLDQDKMNFSTLRNIQGLFAPLKLQMEFKAVQQVQKKINSIAFTNIIAVTNLEMKHAHQK
uniref:Proteasome maturation protein n=1 Tax=Balaenoptera musculus TaxID=9771 RepID=A0A8C0DYP0_BALMU